MSATREVRSPTQARARRTRAALVEAGRAEFSASGYAGATAKSIATRAGVATGSFYLYFKDKDALLREIAVSGFERIAARVLDLLDIPATALANRSEAPLEIRSRVGQVVDAIIDYHREDPGLHAVLTQRRYCDVELDRSTAEGERLMCERLGLLLKRASSPVDHEATAFVLFQMIEGSIHAHVLGTQIVNDARFRAALVDNLIRVAQLPDASEPTTSK